ncbi:hypothetical protein HD554DRAFT_1102702 [Boletus coccyginus]|nr:hypothetical protein HD554DRAFT_1102702 [Boletus coccyginus]
MIPVAVSSPIAPVNAIRDLSTSISNSTTPDNLVDVLSSCLSIPYCSLHTKMFTAVWACLLSGYVPYLQPALSAQQAHKECHIPHIKDLFSSAA